MQDTLRKIVWLASYPKSGNTWFRLFLSALANKGNLDINRLRFQMIYSSRDIFESVSGIDSRYLYDEEAKLLQPEVFRKIAVDSTENLYIKIHDAFVQANGTTPIVPEDASLCAIYFIRNPLDIVASLANHLNKPIHYALTLLCNKAGFFVPQHGNLNNRNQFRQYLSDWSSHVQSWTNGPNFPVYVVRYEDMLENPFQVFKQLLIYTGVTEYSDDAIRAAVEATAFDKLKKQENEKGFNEKFSVETPSFFRSGLQGNWVNELSAQEVETLIQNHSEVMTRFGY
ncbi:sulfotransferase domain-containing protein [Emticicia sp. TH156]|uniref:sulfotransferase domain-containing protein n=1 Tax=Emticicia sp. TH156 TaxID=2067454 RepID=UPI000C766745|nr:sulfotransferase domain-containing protein [Emticicia sp. TH156]PLK44742.1 hypothetical protein C0V77_09840 [Emticicia sp. TH156]